VTDFISPATFWDHSIRHFTGTHLLQTWEWGHAKAQFGWQPMYALWKQEGNALLLSEDELAQIASKQTSIFDPQDISAAALILLRNIPVSGFAKRMCVLYVPKGPLLDWADSSQYKRVLSDLQTLAKERGAIFIKIDPDVRSGYGIPDPAGYTRSGRHVNLRQASIQPPALLRRTSSVS
jgi:lipid II:glycine glycyltransferase (peptidoglycan interpeptide bridge formation enzyme)